MTNFVKGLIVTMYLIVYVYSAYHTTTEPERTVWGWLCVVTFLILAIWAIGAFANNQHRPNNEDN